LEGRHLIVTGANGSGKTSFLKAVYEKVDLLIAKKRGADYMKDMYKICTKDYATAEMEKVKEVRTCLLKMLP
jgi:AAA15 family ATPase/GTPase